MLFWLSAYSAGTRRMLTPTFILIFILYRAVIILPYLWLLLAGDQYLSDIIESIIIGFLVTGILLAIVRLVYREKFISLLWQIYAYVYDGLLYFYPYQYLINRVAGLVNEDKPVRVVDLGGGSGNVTRLLTAKQRTLVDSSSQMIKRAKSRLTHKDIDFITQDIEEYVSRTQEVFDSIVMNNSLYVIQDRKMFWADAHRILSAQGQIIISNSDSEGSLPIIKEHIHHRGFFSLLRPKLLAIFMVDQLINSLSSTGSFSFVSYDTIVEETRGLFDVSFIERCYGGDTNGVNIIVRLNKR